MARRSSPMSPLGSTVPEKASLTAVTMSSLSVEFEAFENGKANGLGYVRGSYFTPELAQKAVSAAGAEGEVMAGAVAARDGQILLIREEDGRYALPTFVQAPGESSETLASNLAQCTGLPASVGFVYSVYDDRSQGKSHIVYRSELGAGDSRKGEFFALDALPLDKLVNSATGDILRRYAAESALGNFGMYVGDERSGRVHAVSGDKQL